MIFPQTLYKLNAQIPAEAKSILTAEALQFVAELQRQFNPKRKQLLAARKERQTAIDKGILPNFLPETKSIRESHWKINPIPADLQDRRVEITGPVSRKMIINGLNAGAKVFMADFEDSNTPTWENIILGQLNLKEAVNKIIQYKNENGKIYTLIEKPAVLFVRPRGWHLEEKNIEANGEPFSASLFDFGLYFFHNAKTLLNNGSGPYFYLPKIENYHEAALWNEVFVFAQNYINIPQGSIKATVLIETILAAFEMDEILHALKEHSAGLNCGRWDYIFSFIKKFINYPNMLLPDRSQITMQTHFMNSYAQLLIQTCHKRGAHAMGGMAAQIPIKNNEQANTIAFEKVKQDKIREVKNGHDGTWVAHPGLVQVAMDVFNEYMLEPNQINNLRNDVHITAADLIKIPEGHITFEGFKNNIDICIQYLASWLKGNGCVPIYNLMEDAATAEISRAQIWQWVNNGTLQFNDGQKITVALFNTTVQEILSNIKEKIGQEVYNDSKFEEAAKLLTTLTTQKTFEEFLTTYAYHFIH